MRIAGAWGRFRSVDPAQGWHGRRPWPRIGHAGLALGALLVLGLVWPAPTQAESVPASFDCAKAAPCRGEIHLFPCGAALAGILPCRAVTARRAARWRAPRATAFWPASATGYATATGSCIADRTFKELSGPSAELSDQAYGCLKVLYLDTPAACCRTLPHRPCHRRPSRPSISGPSRPRVPKSSKTGACGFPPSTCRRMARWPRSSCPASNSMVPTRPGSTASRMAGWPPATPAPNLQQPHPPGARWRSRTTAWRRRDALCACGGLGRGRRR
ncbi:hypothetical protein CDEF62S_04351 [Castellaniella defragrans]